jgi:hypothetical protein
LKQNELDEEEHELEDDEEHELEEDDSQWSFFNLYTLNLWQLEDDDDELQQLDEEDEEQLDEEEEWCFLKHTHLYSDELEEHELDDEEELQQCFPMFALESSYTSLP